MGPNSSKAGMEHAEAARQNNSSLSQKVLDCEPKGYEERLRQSMRGALQPIDQGPST